MLEASLFVMAVLLRLVGITLVLEAIGIAGIASSALVCQLYVYALDLVVLWLVAHWANKWC